MLGIFDGLTALVSAPEVAPQIVSGSSSGRRSKGSSSADWPAGLPAKRVRSLKAGLIFGLVVGAFFAFLVAAMPDPSGKHYYWEIMLPGSIVGLLVGYATQRWGGEPARAA